MNGLLLFLGCLVYTYGIAFLLGCNYREYASAWYLKLKRPSFALPDTVFVYIFPVFYFLEAIALWRLFHVASITPIVLPLALLVAATMVGALWSRLFFSYRRADLALYSFCGELILDWAAFAALVSVDTVAALAFLPICVWASYAIWVNYSFLTLNEPFWQSQRANR